MTAFQINGSNNPQTCYCLFLRSENKEFKIMLLSALTQQLLPFDRFSNKVHTRTLRRCRKFQKYKEFEIFLLLEGGTRINIVHFHLSLFWTDRNSLLYDLLDNSDYQSWQWVIYRYKSNFGFHQSYFHRPCSNH